MTFTIRDADSNEGKFRSKIAGKLVAQAKKSSKLWKEFAKTCSENDRNPRDVLSNYVTRAIKYDEDAEMLLETEPTLRDLREDEIKIGAVKAVKQLMNELNINESNSEEDEITKLIRDEIKSSAKSPLEEFTENVDRSGQGQNQRPEVEVEEGGKPQKHRQPKQDEDVLNIEMDADKFEKLVELDKQGRLDDILEQVESDEKKENIRDSVDEYRKKSEENQEVESTDEMMEEDDYGQSSGWKIDYDEEESEEEQEESEVDVIDKSAEELMEETDEVLDDSSGSETLSANPNEGEVTNVPSPELDEEEDSNE